LESLAYGFGRGFVIEVEPGRAVMVDWSAERYHADRETTSRGQLLELIDRPARYHRIYEVGDVEKPPQTKALRLGNAVHLAALEPAEFVRRVCVPHPKRRGSDTWGRLRQPDAVELTADEYRMIAGDHDRGGLAQSFHAHEFVQRMLACSHRIEQTILWRPAVVPQLLVRVRTDVLVELDDATAVILDIKTDLQEPSAEAFRRHVAKYRYYLQAAMYRDAVAALWPEREVHFVFVAIVKSPPYEAACYDLDAEAFAVGRNQYEAAMVDLVRRRETGDWQADWQRSVHTLSLPRWAMKQ
jgi:hypothetical protein